MGASKLCVSETDCEHVGWYSCCVCVQPSSSGIWQSVCMDEREMHTPVLHELACNGKELCYIVCMPAHQGLDFLEVIGVVATNLLADCSRTRSYGPTELQQTSFAESMCQERTLQHHMTIGTAWVLCRSSPIHPAQAPVAGVPAGSAGTPSQGRGYLWHRGHCPASF